MKIAFVVTNLRGGGAEKAVLKLAALLAKRGHETCVVLLENIVEHAIPDGVTINQLSASSKAAPSSWLGKRLLAWQLRQQLKTGNWQLIISTLPYADEILALSGLPRICHRIANTLSAEISALQKTNPAKASRRAARYRRLYQTNKLIAVSKGVAEDLVEHFGVTRQRIHLLHNPFDSEAIAQAAKQTPTALPNTPYLLHVGRFMPQKRHDLLFDAYRQAQLAQPLVLLTPASPGLDTLIAAYGLQKQVIVAGFQANPYPWMAHADLLILASDREGMPNVLIEALLCGTPVVSTDCPSGPAEILTGAWQKNLTPCNAPSALAVTIKEALLAGFRGRPSNLDKFSPAIVAAGYEALAKEES